MSGVTLEYLKKLPVPVTVPVVMIFKSPFIVSVKNISIFPHVSSTVIPGVVIPIVIIIIPVITLFVIVTAVTGRGVLGILPTTIP